MNQDKQTIEGNKVIAEFMGAKVESNNHTGRDVTFPEITHGLRTHKSFQLQYHTSWDWLMLVVQKCYSLCNDLQHPDQEEELSVALLSCDISEVHEAVVKFITWYNSQPKTPNNG